MRSGGAQLIERGRVREQALAPALDRRQARFFGSRRRAPLREPRPDRLGIDVAHQPADVLHLPAPRLVLA